MKNGKRKMRLIELNLSNKQIYKKDGQLIYEAALKDKNNDIIGKLIITEKDSAYVYDVIGIRHIHFCTDYCTWKLTQPE